MRTLFIAISKVIGLLQVYTGLTYIFTILPLMRMLDHHSSSENNALFMRTAYGSSFALTVTSIAAMLVLTFGVAWLLLFRAEWLADKLKVPEQNDQPPLSGDAILGAGARLLGLFFVVQAAPELAGALAKAISHAQWAFGERDVMGGESFRQCLFDGVWTGLLRPAIKLGLGLVLALKTETVLSWMNRKKETAEPEN